MFEPVVISTGQHELMVDEILAMAGTVADGHLDVGTGYESLNARVSNEMGRFEEFFTRRGVRAWRAACSWLTSMPSTPGCSGRCVFARRHASSPSAATGRRPSVSR